ncbi:hypothetical protein M413DRAFT_373035 [Hebeloma cylindrosporum]|uniref:Uncharacterized protein n=1 Tax=Hebeloma cylindrosporum TaxID=76867 RepID=A0A0C3CIM5_HEBCY|nr:hypothetical protein M413DRAFT_373035 [Hebeloma cylindrosporum h7]
MIHSFAALKPAGTAVEAIKRGERGTDLWLWDRLTIRISRMAFSGSQDPSRLEINTKVEHYDNIMKLMFPKQWAELDNMPNCDKAAIEIREQLHKDLGAEGPAIAVDGELESAMKCFANHPAALYNAIKEAQKYREQEKLGVHVPEAQTQRVWDNLLHAYTSSHGKAQSSFPVEPLPLSYHHEKTLRFPINDRVKNPLRYPPKEQAQLQHGFALKQVCELERLNISLDSPVHSILAKAFHDATALSAFFSSNSPRAPTPRDDEPSTGRADSVLVIVVPPANPHPAAKPRELALSGNILQLYDTKAFHLERIPSPVVSSTMHELCLMCPEVIEHLGNRTGTCPQVHPVAGYHNASLCVPFFCVENKKDDKTVLQAFNQCRIYCISCVKFLAALGIVGFPVYGLVTTGLQGTIMVAWNSQELTGKKGVVDAKDKCDFTILMDSYLVSFDLTIPLEAYRFMLAVHRIYLYGLELQDEIKKQNLEDILTRPGFADWAMPPKARTPKLQGN